MILERLEGLDEISWQLLNAAAVIGRSFNFDICRRASGRSEEEAVAALEEALRLCQELGDRHRQSAILNNMADLHHAAGRADEALEYLKRAAAIFTEIGNSIESWQPEIWKLTEW